MATAYEREIYRSNGGLEEVSYVCLYLKRKLNLMECFFF